MRSLRPGRGSYLLAALAALPALAPAADLPGLGEPVAISPPEANASRATLATDVVDNAFVAMLLDGRLQVAVPGPASGTSWSMSEIRIPQEDPSIEVSGLEVIFVSFAREDNELGAKGREVFLASNPGGEFNAPLNISANRIDDRSPALALDRSGSARLAWVSGEGSDARLIHYRHPRGPATEIGTGERPSLAIDLDGRSHVAFQAGDAVRVVDEGADGFGPPAEVDRPGGGEEIRPQIGVDARDRTAVVYAAGGELRLVVRREAAFGPPRILDRGLPAAAEVAARLRDDGRLVIAYVRDGDVFVIRGDVEGELVPEQATRTPEPETSPSAREDAGGNLHLCFVRGGRVLYANTAAPPRADFSIDPAGGEAPLSVEFRDASGGEVRGWRWSFGDGAVSSQRNPIHSYTVVGTYTVGLEVWGPGGRSSAEKTAAIRVDEPSYTMRVGDIAAFPGQKGVWAPVVGFHRQPAQGFQMAGRVDPSAAVLQDVSLQATVTERLDPEFFRPSIAADGASFTVGLLLDFSEPFDGRTIDAGDGQILAHLVFDVPETAPPGDYSIVLLPAPTPSEIGCMYIVDGFSKAAFLSPGRLRVIGGTPPVPRLFTRGDIDGNGIVDITDPLAALGYLFHGDPIASCPKAVDADDSGNADVTDPIYLLTFLFLAGPAPPPPFPMPGLDPTDDAIPCAP